MYRPWHLGNDPLLRKELDAAAARRWRGSLVAGVGRAKAELPECRSPKVREYAVSLLEGLEADLRQLEMGLSR